MGLENKNRKKARDKYEKKEPKKTIHVKLEEQLIINSKTRISSVNIEQCVKSIVNDDVEGKIHDVILGMATARIYYEEKDDIPRNIFCDIQKFDVLGVLETVHSGSSSGWNRTDYKISYVIQITPYHNVP